MTKDEVLSKYGDVPLAFSSYYKYCFSFRGTAADGAEIYCSIGGNHDDIYRLRIEPNSVTTLKEDRWSYADVTINKEEVWCERSW